MSARRGGVRRPNGVGADRNMQRTGALGVEPKLRDRDAHLRIAVGMIERKLVAVAPQEDCKGESEES